MISSDGSGAGYNSCDTRATATGEHKIMVLLKIFAILAGLFIAYFIYWGYQDRQAESAAYQFCNALVIGSALSGAIAQAKVAGARFVTDEVTNPKLFFFPGPIFNGFFCTVAVADGKVISRNVTRNED